MFGAVHVPGFGYVQGQGLGNAGQLGDDASVMMISGLGAGDDQRQVAVDPATGKVQSVTGAGFSLQAALTQPVTIGGMTLPLWGWLLVLTGVVGVAGYMFFFKKK